MAAKLNSSPFSLPLDFIPNGAALYAESQKLKDGQVSEPLTEADGVHVLAMVSNDPSLQLDFPSARDRVMADYKREEIARVQTAQVKFLRSKAQILLQPEYR